MNKLITNDVVTNLCYSKIVEKWTPAVILLCLIITRGGMYGGITLISRKVLNVEPEGFSEGSGYISPDILTLVIIQILSI